MRSQGFRPPERVIDVLSAVGTMAGSFLGPNAMSLALPLVPLAAEPGAGDPSVRYRSIYVAAGALLLIALLAGTAAELAVLVPPLMLLALAGLALVGVLATALRRIIRGPLLLGPMFAFSIALSKMSLLGLGPFFWSLVLGIGVSLLLERDEWNRLRAVGVGSGEAGADQEGDVGPRAAAPWWGRPLGAVDDTAPHLPRTSGGSRRSHELRACPEPLSEPISAVFHRSRRYHEDGRLMESHHASQIGSQRVNRVRLARMVRFSAHPVCGTKLSYLRLGPAH
jgi:hypothetical protein